MDLTKHLNNSLLGNFVRVLTISSSMFLYTNIISCDKLPEPSKQEQTQNFRIPKNNFEELIEEKEDLGIYAYLKSLKKDLQKFKEKSQKIKDYIKRIDDDIRFLDRFEKKILDKKRFI